MPILPLTLPCSANFLTMLLIQLTRGARVCVFSLSDILHWWVYAEPARQHAQQRTDHILRVQLFFLDYSSAIESALLLTPPKSAHRYRNRVNQRRIPKLHSLPLYPYPDLEDDTLLIY